MSTDLDPNKIANETGFATLGRAIAGNMRTGQSIDKLVEDARIRRRQEQDSADRMTQFAGLARQVGDASRAGKDIAPLLDKLVQLRTREIG